MKIILDTNVFDRIAATEGIGATATLTADMLVTADAAFARRVRALGAPCRVQDSTTFFQA